MSEAELNLEGKVNLHDYYKSLERLTDNTGTADRYERYKQMSHCVRLGRHIKALRRAGRAHDPNGVEATSLGELAVECPACPHPNKNLPPDWQNAPDNVRWLYVLFIMVDANFRARCKDRGPKDFELGGGWQYFVDEKPYMTHVTEHRGKKEENICSAEHNAIVKANLRKEGYVASGVGAVLCARHALVRRNGAGDLQLGEAYANMDYIVLATLMKIMVAIFISYDIACQWSKAFAKRILDFPPEMRIDFSQTPVRYGIPKKHFRVHGPNHSKYSLNLLPKVGRTYGERIETHWGHMNGLPNSAREMSPGGRHELMNDHWSSWNWQKIIELAQYLLKCLKEARAMATKQHEIFNEHTQNFAGDVVKKWEQMIKTWEADPSNPDPYEEPQATVTLNKVRLDLAREEAADAARGEISPHEVSQSVFLQVGLELEEQQLVLREKAENATRDGSHADIQEKRNVLQRRITLWQEIQRVHMPISVELCPDPVSTVSALATRAYARINAMYSSAQTPTTDDPSTSSAAPDPPLPPPASMASLSSTSTSPDSTPTDVQAKDVRLFLPSCLPAVLHDESLHPLAEKERRLRLAQADDCLEDVRRYRRILAGITEFKRLNVSGTGNRRVGRIRTLYEKFQTKLNRAITLYRTAYAALIKLDPSGAWRDRLRELRDEDNRGPGREDDESEGRHEVSWIWLTPRSSSAPTSDASTPSPDTATEYADSMRVEWAKLRARAERWEEEEKLLLEEMRRVIRYFEWKAGWWRSQGDCRLDVPRPLREALGAYAEKQGAMFEHLALKCAASWMPYYDQVGITADWVGEYRKRVKGKGGLSDTRDDGDAVDEAQNWHDYDAEDNDAE
ncbi:hypothetical protein C8Q76DRAFT_802395 [Earliella scabrosa]|nr:hypothetical protein C8Q76DRAFT_802395 [Earliella scabrosa]